MQRKVLQVEGSGPTRSSRGAKQKLEGAGPDQRGQEGFKSSDRAQLEETKGSKELRREASCGALVTLSELMGGFPTLHEVPLVAGYPETGTVDQAFDERTGEELAIDLGTKALSGARVSELTRMMPLSRRGLTAAILAVCLTPVAGQPKERDIFDPMTFWNYVLLHVLAAL